MTYTAAEAAKVLRISRALAYELVRLGSLPQSGSAGGSSFPRPP